MRLLGPFFFYVFVVLGWGVGGGVIMNLYSLCAGGVTLGDICVEPGCLHFQCTAWQLLPWPLLVK